MKGLVFTAFLFNSIFLPSSFGGVRGQRDNPKNTQSRKKTRPRFDAKLKRLRQLQKELESEALNLTFSKGMFSKGHKLVESFRGSSQKVLIQIKRLDSKSLNVKESKEFWSSLNKMTQTSLELQDVLEHLDKVPNRTSALFDVLLKVDSSSNKTAKGTVSDGQLANIKSGLAQELMAVDKMEQRLLNIETSRSNGLLDSNNRFEELLKSLSSMSR